MSGKRKKAPPQQQVRVTNPDGSTTTMTQGSYNEIQKLTQDIQLGDMSSLDKKDFMNDINNNLMSFADGLSMDEMTKRFEAGLQVKGNDQIRAEMADAIAGQKPKYRYRKYLDQVTRMQSDQPGQLQTVLARSGRGNGSVLGGGTF